MLVYYILFIRVTRFCVVFSHLSLLAVKNIMTLRYENRGVGKKHYDFTDFYRQKPTIFLGRHI